MIKEEEIKNRLGNMSYVEYQEFHMQEVTNQIVKSHGEYGYVGNQKTNGQGFTYGKAYLTVTEGMQECATHMRDQGF